MIEHSIKPIDYLFYHLKINAPKVEIKDFNVSIDGKNFFDVPVKKKEEAYEKIIETSKNNDYTTVNLLDYEYLSNYYKLVTIHLSKQIELGNPELKQQVDFIVKLEEDEATIFFIVEKSEETNFEFSKNSVSITYNGNTKDYKLAEWFK